jgi:cytosine/adenosine deaminase-related metal-dependent hydrolase
MMPPSSPSDATRDDDLVVTNAELLVTMTGEEIRGGWVSIRNGVVEAVGAPGREPPAAQTLDAGGCLVTPGLVNAHHHIYQNLTRAYGPAANLRANDWWTTVAQMWTRLDEEATYVSTWIGLVELALGGCTTTADHLYVHPRPRLLDAQVAAAREVGLRFHAVRGAMDMRQDMGGVLPDVLVEDRDAILADCERLVDAYHDRRPEAMVRIAIGPCTVFDSTTELYREAAELAERLDVRLHTHLAELREEEEYTNEKFGCRPIARFEELGWGSSRAWAAHCIFVDDDEISRLAEWGTGVAHCPSTNMLVCEGIAPVQEMRARGVPVGLACDGSAYTDHASLWLEARTALLLGRLLGGATSMSARDALEIATLGSAACLGRQGEIGVLAPGAVGDLVAWPLEGVAFAGAWTDPVEAWLRCGPVAARHTVVGGKVIVRDNLPVHGDLEEMLQRHGRISRAWQGVAG